MPSDHLNCPLCQREVARNNLSKHLLSSSHINDIVSRNSAELERQYQKYVVQKVSFESSLSLFPLRVKNESFRACFGCKKVYMDDNLHFSNNTECKAKHVKGIAALLGKSAVDKDDLEGLLKEKDERIKMLEAKLAAAPTQKVGSDELQKKVKELEEENESLMEENEKSANDYVTLWEIVKRLTGKNPPKGDNAAREFAKEILSGLKSNDYVEEQKPVIIEEPVVQKAIQPINESKIQRAVNAHIAKDWEAQSTAYSLLTNAEAAEVTKRIRELDSKPKTTPLPSISSDARPAPSLHPPILTTTKKVLMRPKTVGVPSGV